MIALQIGHGIDIGAHISKVGTRSGGAFWIPVHSRPPPPHPQPRRARRRGARQTTREQATFARAAPGRAGEVRRRRGAPAAPTRARTRAHASRAAHPPTLPLASRGDLLGRDRCCAAAPFAAPGVRGRGAGRRKTARAVAPLCFGLLLQFRRPPPPRHGPVFCNAATCVWPDVCHPRCGGLAGGSWRALRGAAQPSVRVTRRQNWNFGFRSFLPPGGGRSPDFTARRRAVAAATGA